MGERKLERLCHAKRKERTGVLAGGEPHFPVAGVEDRISSVRLGSRTGSEA